MKRLTRNQMAERVARDIPDGAVVNLGIGLPTLVANHLPKDREVLLHSENGVLGMGPAPAARMRSARFPCGTSSSSILPARYRPSKTCESVWRGNEQMILRTRPVLSSAARP